MSEKIVSGAEALLLEAVGYDITYYELDGEIKNAMPRERADKDTASKKRSDLMKKVHNGTATQDDVRVIAGLSKKIKNLQKTIGENVKEQTSTRRQMGVGSKSAVNEAKQVTVANHGLPVGATALMPSRDTKLKISNATKRLDALNRQLTRELANPEPIKVEAKSGK